jgi:redox-sensitive bicupin YhaK (pirin superfamily)
MEGFQLWINLPARNKMIAPYYRDIPAQAIPEFTTPEGILVRVIAGESHGVTGAVVRPDTEPLYLDIHMPAGTRFSQPVNSQFNAFTYTYRGEVKIAGTAVPDRHMAILANQGDTITVEAEGDSRLILVAGKPLNEPIVQYGPFVMNTAEEIQQTLRDYRNGDFERATVQAL